ncbi:MAG: DUF6435 family protein [Alcanivorax sp.]|nr:DUF6435 family protein [Alcanivorax sp.]
MLGLFRSDPKKKLQKAYEAKLQQAMTLQRNGDIRGYSLVTEEAEAIYARLQALDKAD